MALTPTGTPQPKTEPDIEAANAVVTEMIAGWVSYNVKYRVAVPEPPRPKSRVGFWVTDTDENHTFWFSDDLEKGKEYWFSNWSELHADRYVPAEAAMDGWTPYLPLPLEEFTTCIHGFPTWRDCQACIDEPRWRNQ